jgi:TetR/AcrR family transcriptional repressor of nem operon
MRLTIDPTDRYVCVMERRTGSREKLLQAARIMFLERGYPGTSLSELVSEVGVTKGSFFHHFTTKEELALEVLLAEFETTAGTVASGSFVDVSDPVERVIEFIDHTDRNAEDLWNRGSLLGVFAASLAATSPQIEALVSQAYRRLADGIAPIFEPIAERAGGQPDATALAEHFLTIIEGGATLAQAHADPQHLHKALRGFRHYVSLLSAD